ncbi:MAG: hypothetical protein H6825_11540 [Planctomycetes bacterium]|nr:hypothetical protein [Planctomycetota bacterium]
MSTWLATLLLASSGLAQSFVNFETAPVHPLELLPDEPTLLLASLPTATLEVFDVSGASPQHAATIAVGLDPVSVRARDAHEAWVVNGVGDSVSVVDLDKGNVRATLPVGDEPADVVFAGTPRRAFVSCGRSHELWVFDPEALQAPPVVLPMPGNSPRALAVSPDEATVYVAFFESGNGTTSLLGGFDAADFVPPAVDAPEGPYGGVNPPPNAGTQLVPPLAAGLPAPPPVSLIVRQAADGTWRDDNGADWTALVSGPQASESGRVVGWQLLDHDIATIDAQSLAITTIDRLMTLDMALAVNPATGRLLTVGLESSNEVRYEPNLNGVFVRVLGALVDPDGSDASLVDLNPHLDYTTPTLPLVERRRSIGDPRAVAFAPDGSRAYVAGMGSGNLIVLDAQGQRAGLDDTIEVGTGPVGLAIGDDGRLFTWDRFGARLVQVDLASETVSASIPLFDPTPDTIRIGRAHLYDTHATSGLGQLSCASCHVDARTDGLAWDLGNPQGALIDITDQNLGAGIPALAAGIEEMLHPMKGPMTTQTLQDIIGKEPFHWRGDKDGIEEFNGAFTNLQGAEAQLDAQQMQELKAFLATIHYPPNPYRQLDNSLPRSLVLPGFTVLDGSPAPPGDAVAGLLRFATPSSPTNPKCTQCHTLPTGMGTGSAFDGVAFEALALGPFGEQHHLIQSRAGGGTLKVPNLRDVYARTGLDLRTTPSRRGFGTTHQGALSFDAFLRDVAPDADEQGIADIAAFVLSITGSDLPTSLGSLVEPPGGPSSQDAHAAVGRAVTVAERTGPRIELALQLAALADAGRVDLIAKGRFAGEPRGFLYAGDGTFQSDRADQILSFTELTGGADEGCELTFVAVPTGTGMRLGVDRDEDGFFDTDELDAFADPSDPSRTPGPWKNGGAALAGSHGAPQLVPSGTLADGSRVTLSLGHALPGATSFLVLGFAEIGLPFKGGSMVPAPDLVLGGLVVDASGALELDFVWPSGVPSGAFTAWQHWIVDPAGPHGFAASNAVLGTSP